MGKGADYCGTPRSNKPSASYHKLALPLALNAAWR
jgi:hypothetical protein